MESQRRHQRLLSFEFFPPKTPEGMAKLRAARAQLAQLNPRFFSVTFGAGGSTREGTLDTVLEIRATATWPPRTCRAWPRRRRRSARCSSTTASHGDPPRRGASRRPAVRLADAGEFRYACRAGGLHPRGDRRPRSTSRSPAIPSTTRRRARPRTTSRLQAQGGRGRRFRDHAVLLQPRMLISASSTSARRRASPIPIVPGIMPIASFSQLARFSDACGAEIPRWIRRKLEGFGDDTASIRAFGLDVVTEPVRPPARRRRAGAALLHPEPGRPHHHDLAAPRPVERIGAGLEIPCRARARGRYLSLTPIFSGASP